MAAGESESPNATAALEELCRSYWYPLYAYTRRRGFDPHQAQDMVQEFFARFLARNYLEGLSAERGKFRSFLLASLNHFLANERERAQAQKRGGGQIPISLDDDSAEDRYRQEPAWNLTPEMIYERRWALAVLDQALVRLQTEYVKKPAQFERLKVFLEGDVQRGDYDRAAAELSMSPGAIATAVQRLRQRYRQLVRAEVTRTVADAREVDEEMQHLIHTLAR